MIGMTEVGEWEKLRIRRDEIEKYLQGGASFIPEEKIHALIQRREQPDPGRVRDILRRSLAIESLDPDEVVDLMNVQDPDLLQEMRSTALTVKKKVYDNRIVTFAPLYLGNKCVNNCVYCGFRKDNPAIERSVLAMDGVRQEARALAGRIGHKRLILVYGEHPETDVDYIVDTIKAVYDVDVPVKNARGQIRRVNVNAAPMQIEELKRINEAGIGTYQVFQETYHRPTYEKLHPKGTLKGDYLWRLTALHRAQEAGIDDVGIGALFGLYDWRFEMLGLVHHAAELERAFGIGAHTVSFPRLEPALNTPYTRNPRYAVSDEDFKRIILIIRLAIPYTGMILTARESAELRRQAIELGITQMDASTRIGVGCYSDNTDGQQAAKQQFMLGDTRSLDEVIRELAQEGYITSFCTAGYRCGRTGKCIMDLLRSGTEGKFCKMNAVLTFREWVDDFAPADIRQVCELAMEREIEEIRLKLPTLFPKFYKAYERTLAGERDICF